MQKAKTINLKDRKVPAEQNYATVPTRIKEFREKCPNGEIKTEPMLQNDGSMIIKAYILKDKKDQNSASATGHSMGKVGKGQKDFEKLETIAVGRALAMLGFMASGEIASSEEMETFYEYLAEKKDEAIEKMESCKTQEELKSVFISLGNLMADKEIIEKKDQLKLKLKK
ncbi:hypothetical protein E6Q11_04270 [Candidatus Dojkabacteria bacterium]|uniref:Uncharacterized protein n=1 Tax=Candidatus Dojkabacteria bacterium TaxID=2099670 RepID=A0A5C7J520_9BACT|nr:MAG: hypothetical protein E6Q11_04270 [Candidatus Dojkabacteria bacterium]